MNQYPQILMKNISELKDAEYNPRFITDESLGRLTKSIAELGNLSPVTWNVRTGRVIGGHQRLKCYKAMGKTQIEVWAVDLPETKEKIANIALNKLSGEFDMPKLKDIILELDTGGMDMEISGFSMEEMQSMMETAPPETQGMPAGLGEPVINYNVIFDNEDQQARWFKFLRFLKEKYPDYETIAQRMDIYLQNLKELENV